MNGTAPTLADLRARLEQGGLPGPLEEICFDLEPENADSPYLPDVAVVARAITLATAAGDFDHLPGSTPLWELAAGRPEA